MDRITRTAVAALILAVLVGCSTISSGTVVSKRYEEARDWQEYVADYVWVNIPIWSCGASGKTSSCRTTYATTRQQVGGHQEQRHEPAHWYLTLDDGEDTGEVEVDEWRWREAQVGSWWSK